jgi:hypothetical protein
MNLDPSLRPVPPVDIVASTVTLHDVFPKLASLDIDIDPSRRPFAVASRRAASGKVLEPDLIVVTRDGFLHRFVPAQDGSAGRIEEPAAICVDAALKGGSIHRVAAIVTHAGSERERLVVTVAGKASDGRNIFKVLRRDGGGPWRSVDPEWGRDKAHLPMIATGFASLADGTHVHYACANTRDDTLYAYAFAANGAQLRARFSAGPPRRGRGSILVTLPGAGLCLAITDGNYVLFYRTTTAVSGSTLTVTPTPGEPVLTCRVPTNVGQIDASHLLPINDTEGLCHGLLVRTEDDWLCGVQFPAAGEVQMKRLTLEHDGKPHRSRDVTYSFDDDELHVYVTDAYDLIWHGRGPKANALESLQWAESGQRGRDIEAATLTNEPELYVEGVEDRIDRIVAAPGAQQWTRGGIDVPEPKLELIPADVHAITISAVTAEKLPVADVRLQVSAERPVLVEHQGRLYRLHPRRPRQFTTNALGGVRFRIRSSGLEAPAILVRSLEMPNVPERSFLPNESALDRLSGQGKFQYSGADLIARKLLPAGTKLEEANACAASFQQSARVALGRPAFSAARGERPAGIVIYRDGDVHRLASGDAYLSEMAALDGGALVTLSSSASFWAWLQKTWDTAKKVIIDPLVNAVRVIVDDVVQFVTDAARDIANLVNSILAKMNKLGADLVKAAKDLMKFLSEAIDWNEIFRCKDAVRDYTLASLAELNALVGKALPDKVSQAITWGEQRLDFLLNEAAKKVGGKGVAPGDAVKKPLLAEAQTNSAQAYLLQHALPVSGTSSIPGDLLTQDAKNRIAALEEKISSFTSNEKLKNELRAVTEAFQNKATLEGALSIDVGSVLQVIRPLLRLALTVVDVVQRHIFELVSLLLEAFRKILETKLSALGGPFELIRQIYILAAPEGDKDPSLLDIGTLLFVAPGVILHRIVTGKSFVLPERPAKLATGLSAVAAMLAVANGEAAPEGIISDAMLKTYQFIAPIYSWVEAASYLARILINGIENGLRLSELNGGPGMPGPVAILIGIMDWTPMVWALGEALIAHREQIAGFMDSHPATVLLVALVPIAFLLFAVVISTVEAVKLTFDKLPAIIRQTVLGTLDFHAGIAMLLIQCGLIAVYEHGPLAPGKGATAKEKERYYLTRAASIWLQFRRFVQLGFPAGYALTKFPKTAPLGWILMGGVAVIDTACYGGYAAAMVYRLAVYPTTAEG